MTHLLADLGMVDFDRDVPQAVGLYCSCSAAQARHWSIPNLSQPNPGPRGDGSPCRSPGSVKSSFGLVMYTTTLSNFSTMKGGNIKREGERLTAWKFSQEAQGSHDGLIGVVGV